MRRSAVPLLLGLIAVALVAMLGYAMARSTDDGTAETLDAKVEAGKIVAAPGSEIELPRLGAAGTTSLAALRGKIVVLNFWASWCPPCEAESPILERVQKQLTKDGTGTVLGATYNDTTTDAKAFMREHGLTYPTVQDIGTDLARKYSTDKLPETFVIDGQGKIVAISRGQIEQEAFLTRAIAKATKSAASTKAPA